MKTHYQVLKVANDADVETVRRAYKERLLQIHPDKNGPDSVTRSRDVSVNMIQEAYRVLSNIGLREKYDSELLRKDKKAGIVNLGEGLDEYSLDVFDFDENSLTYRLDCPRCQARRGFQILEDLLEDCIDDVVQPDTKTDLDYHVLVQCISCSLWLKVGFQIAEDEEQD